MVEVLLRAGADPSLLDKDGRSPIHLAALAGDNTSLRPLLAHLGERHAHLVNTPDYHGETIRQISGSCFIMVTVKQTEVIPVLLSQASTRSTWR